MGVRNVSILLFGMLGCGLLAIYFGKELNWDLANYHYYNPISFLQSRWNIDYWPSTLIHVHFTPTLDFLTYFLIHYFPPITTVFLLGAIHGINFWLIYAIAYALTDKRILLSLLLAALGLYGPTALPGIGSFQHDNLVSLFVLSFILCQITLWKAYAQDKLFSRKLFLFSGLILGVGVGCKLTTGLFIPAYVLSLICLSLPWRFKLKLILLFSASVTIGIILSSGYWMLFLWQQYQNPIYPLWNAVFHSPYFPAINWHDARFLPKTLSQVLFFPFYFSLDGRTNDVPFRDFRFAICYVLVIACGLQFIFSKMRRRKSNASLVITWFLLFFIFSYVFWQSYFSIMRYIVVLEMLSPILIYLLLTSLISDKTIAFAFVSLSFFFIAITLTPASMVRAPWYQADYFNVKLPSVVTLNQPSQTVLTPFPAYALQTHPRPQLYLIPFFPKNWRFIGISYTGMEYTLSNKLPALLQSNQSIYLLVTPTYLASMYQVAMKLGFVNHGHCYRVASDRQRITGEKLLLCAVSR